MVLGGAQSAWLLPQRCGCAAGFRLMEDGGTCADIDECEGPDACGHLCSNSPGSFRCDCHPGYLMEAGGHECKIRGKVLQTRLCEVHTQHLFSAAEKAC